MSTNSEFSKQLGADISCILGESFKYRRSRLEFSRPVAEGHDVVILSVSGKYSPFVNVAFYFGKNFCRVKEIEKSIGDYQFPYHVQQYSPYRQPLFAATYNGPDNWSINLQDAPKHLAEHVANAIHGMALPFFNQFQDIATARDAVAGNSPHCFNGPMFWRQLLLLDASLGDLDHFRAWATCLDDWTRDQAELELLKVAQATGCVA